jgi:hypothetical protein
LWLSIENPLAYLTSFTGFGMTLVLVSFLHCIKVNTKSSDKTNLKKRDMDCFFAKVK